MKVAFFDSGIGGITVLAEAIKLMPDEDYIYFADTKNVPYGSKPVESVRKHVFDSVAFLVDKGIKVLVIACNTATSISVLSLREQHGFPIIGMEPAVKPAVAENSDNGKRVLVLATPITLKESKFQTLVQRVDQNNIVDSLALPELVTFAEKLMFESGEAKLYLENMLSAFEISNYGTVVLGCTHFPFFKRLFKEILPAGINIIDGAEGTARHLKYVLREKGILGGGSGQIEFFSSGNTEDDKVSFFKALDFYKSNILPKQDKE